MRCTTRSGSAKAIASCEASLKASDKRALRDLATYSLADLDRPVRTRRKLTIQLQQAQKMEAIGTLAGGIAHDFNNLLMGVQGHNSLMMCDPEFPPRHRENLKGIDACILSAADLTRQLLGFARGGKYEVKPTCLNDLVAKTCDMFSRTKKEVSIRRNLREGLWSVDVRVWHDGMCSGGKTVPPFPSGDVLGSEAGRFWFYVTPAGSRRLNVSAPARGMLQIRETGSQVVPPVLVGGSLPSGTEDAVVDYTISMPGFVLEHGKAKVSPVGYSIVFDPARLAKDHPNLDLVGRDIPNAPGLSDTFTISLLLTGRRGQEQVFRANTVTIQGEEVLYENDPPPRPRGRGSAK